MHELAIIKLGDRGAISEVTLVEDATVDNQRLIAQVKQRCRVVNYRIILVSSNFVPAAARVELALARELLGQALADPRGGFDF